MASERDRDKQAITKRKQDDPELEDALAQATVLQHQLAIDQEHHRHAEAMRATELGSLGRILGGESSVSLTTAFIVVCGGMLALTGSLVMAGIIPAASDFWAKQAERSGAIAMTALSFIFGKSAGRKR
jgi:hypothetical protein